LSASWSGSSIARAGVDTAKDMPWTRYAMALLLFNALGVAVVYFTQRLQVSLPLNPQALANVTPDSGLRHGREFRDQHQLAGLFRRIHDELFHSNGCAGRAEFLSAATGISVAFALIRALRAARRRASVISGSICAQHLIHFCWPLSLALAVIFMGQGVIQNFDTYKDVTTLESLTYSQPKLDAGGLPLKDDKGNAITETLTTHTQSSRWAPWPRQEAIKMPGHQWRRLFQRQFRGTPFETRHP